MDFLSGIFLLFLSFLSSYSVVLYELIPPCDARRREKAGVLYNTVPSLLRSCAQQSIPLIYLSCATEYSYSLDSSVVIVVLNQEMHPQKPQNTLHINSHAFISLSV